MTLSRLAAALLAVALAVALLPEAAYGWGPGTHVFLGSEILRSLNLVPQAVASLLAAHPIEFLYGNLAADISMAKKYAPVGRHCHHWHVAREIHEAAGGDSPLQAATIGYLCHLAADVTAHSVFVPRMLLLASSTRALGHSYWEHRMDAHVGSANLSLARRIVTEYDHSRADALFDRVLSHTLFSFRTNRRIFRGLIRIQDFQRWHNIFDAVIDNSRWDLEQQEIDGYLSASFANIVGLLNFDDSSEAAGQDPIGDEALALSKRLRREILRHELTTAAPELERAADEHFTVPHPSNPSWEQRGGTSNLAERAIAAGLGDPVREAQASRSAIAG